MMGAARITAVLLFPVVLPGCVAALIPVAAGGMMAGKERVGLESGTQSAEVLTERSEVLIEMPAPGPASVKLGGQSMRELPPPMAGRQAFSRIIEYVAAQVSKDPVSDPRQSALLAAPGSLTPDRSDCSIRPPAVVLDLDPPAALLNPAAAVKADPELAQMLREFRSRDITIFWLSALTPLNAGAMRSRLIVSGLDPAGSDGLLLMRHIDDRKQTRRHDVSKTHCVVAIAGDARSDFDELFDYLMDPSAALPIEALLDAGWFLTPPPLLDPSITEGQ